MVVSRAGAHRRTVNVWEGAYVERDRPWASGNRLKCLNELDIIGTFSFRAHCYFFITGTL